MKYSTLVELLGDRAQQQPDKTAYIFLKDGETPSASITYRELDSKARAIAVSLRTTISTGDRALLVYAYPQGLDFIAAFFGCLYAGVVAVTCHPPQHRKALAELGDRLASSQAKIVLTHKTLCQKLKHQLNNELLWLATEEIDSDRASLWSLPEVDGNSLAFLQYTSGSTGTPKGAMITHRSIIHNQEMLRMAFGNSEKSIGVGWLPLFHDMGLIGNVLQALYVGAPCILMSPIAFIQKPWRWLQAISRYQATTSGAPNFAYDLLCHQASAQQKETLNLSSWELAFCGAETVRADTIDRFVATFESCGFRREAFYPCYGMAEATLFIAGGNKKTPPVIRDIDVAALEQNRVAISTSKPSRVRRIVGCGRPWLDGKILIVDPQSLTECQANQVGEIWVSGGGIARGYWQLPAQSDRTFHAYLKDQVAGPFLRTGDLGFLHEDELFVTGRLHDKMVFWGLNHYPEHIEKTVENCHRALRSNCGAAFAVEVDSEERLAIAQEVERSYRQCLVVDEVVEAIRWAVFQDHFVEVYALVLLPTGSLPKTSSGKVQRHLCKTKFLDASWEAIACWRAPQTEPSNIISLIERYLNPLTHLKRYFTLVRGRWRRFVYLLFEVEDRQK